jgi:hypothetical protein
VTYKHKLVTNIHHSKVQDGPHTRWVDNFSKAIGRQLPNIEIGTWADCLWSGVALKKYTGLSNITMDLLHDVNGDIVPAMPRQLTDNGAVETAMQLFTSNTITLEYYATSMVTQFSVQNVPLKPLWFNVTNPKWKAFLKSEADLLSNMYPQSLLALNIGSNLGLARIMRNHYVSEGQDVEGKCLRYTAFNSDIDIFNRILKVFFWESVLMWCLYESLNRRHPRKQKFKIIFWGCPY